MPNSGGDGPEDVVSSNQNQEHPSRKRIHENHSAPRELNEPDDSEESESEGDFDVSQYLSVDDHGQVGVFGLTSTLYNPGQASLNTGPPVQDVMNQLIANSALRETERICHPSPP